MPFTTIQTYTFTNAFVHYATIYLEGRAEEISGVMDEIEQSVSEVRQNRPFNRGLIETGIQELYNSFDQRRFVNRSEEGLREALGGAIEGLGDEVSELETLVNQAQVALAEARGNLNEERLRNHAVEALTSETGLDFSERETFLRSLSPLLKEGFLKRL